MSAKCGEQLNPTLQIRADLDAKVGERLLTTRIALDESPELATWLIEILELCAARSENGTKGRQPQPPDGAVRADLVRGGVLLMKWQPAYGLELQLNPAIAIGLHVSARVPGAPLRTTCLNAILEPELAIWLIARQRALTLPTSQAEAASQVATDAAEVPDDHAFTGRLRDLGVLVDELPGPAAHFPDRAAYADKSLQGWRQPAGAPIPTEVKGILSRHTPDLPPNRDLLWTQDTSTGLVFPNICPSASTYDHQGPPAEPPERDAQWRRQHWEARESLLQRGYAVLREILPPVQRDRLQQFSRQLVERGYFPSLGDGQVERRAAIYNQRTAASLHHGLALLLSDIVGEPLAASYCYLAQYESGAVLRRHIDRPQCAYNLSVVFDMVASDAVAGPPTGIAQNKSAEGLGSPEPWPIYLEVEGEPVAVHLNVGDGLFYSGTNLYHWRDALPAGQRAVVCFYHFVSAQFRDSLS